MLGCVAGFALAVSQASANLVVNGDFEAGNTGFTSGYTYSGTATTTDMWPEGTYNVDTNPKLHHYLWTSMGDHTTGTGNMLIVNAATTGGVNVWTGSFVPPLAAGTTYKFSAWAANVYPDSPAQLEFSVGATSLGSITPTGNGVWQQFSATFVAGAGSPSFLDLNIAASGNDFAVDDISVTAVPEPTTALAGALLLLPFGASTIQILRRKP